MKIYVNNQQSLQRVRLAKFRQLARHLINQSLGHDTCHWQELSILLTTNEGIASIHALHLDDPSTTDVISYSFDPIPGDTAGKTGEIIINVQRAIETVGSVPADIAREIALYLAHGCDHLGGATDSTPEASKSMRRRELRWLAAPTVAVILQALIPGERAS